MNYWIFKCDPEKYSLSDRLRNESKRETTWLVTRYKMEIAPGDVAFLMETGTKRAIRAVMTINSSPQDMEELPHELPFWRERDTERRCRVLGTLTHRVELPIEEVKAVELLKGLPIFGGFQQGTNFKIKDPNEGSALLELATRAS